jgi:iron complex outermembrane receptor protein
MAFHYGPELHSDHNTFDDWELGQGGFRLDWDNRKNDVVSLQGDLYRGSIGESEEISYLSLPRSAVVNTPETVSGSNLLFKWQRKINEKSDFQLQAYYDRTWRLGSQLGEKRNTFDLDFIHHLNVLPRQEFTWGVGARWSPSDFIQTVPAVAFQPYHQSDDIYSSFLQDRITILQDSVWLTLGSKFEHNIYTGWETQPDARILWTPSSRQSVWAAVTRAVRSPSRLDEDLQLTSLFATNPMPVFLSIVGNRQFVSEKLLGYELGYRRLLNSKLYFDLALFCNRYNDLTTYGSPLIESETFSDPPGLVAIIPWTNGISGTTEGFEIAPDWKPMPWLETRGSWSYLNMHLTSKIGDPAVSTIYADEGSSPRHTVSFQARISLPKRLQLDSVWRYVSALPAQYPSGLPAAYVNAYSTADFRLARQMNRSLELSISGQNLLQPSHSEFAGDPGALVLIGRSLYVALAWRERDVP